MKVTNVALYGGLDDTVAETAAIKSYLDSLDIEYANLFYSDSSQFEAVLKPVNTWFDDKEITKFPFVIWDLEDTTGKITRNVAMNLKEVKASNLRPTSGSTK
jgi:hypothetical protein